MTTLFDIVYGAHKKLGSVRVGVSTAMTTSVLNDTALAGDTVDDVFNNGTLFVVASTNSSMAGRFSRVSDYSSAGTITYESSLGSTEAAITYAVTEPQVNHYVAIELANDALRNIGSFVFTNRAIVSSANQQVYTLSTSIGYAEPIRVDMMGRIGSSTADPEFEEIHGWEIVPNNTPGGAYSLVLDRQPLVSRDIRVWYDGQHASVRDSTSIIDIRVHPERVVLEVAYAFIQYRNARNRGGSPFDIEQENKLAQQVEDARARFPIDRPQRRSKMLVVGKTEKMGGDRGPWPPPYGPT